jgi:hypothetical protein
VHDDVGYLLSDALAGRSAPPPPVGGEWQLPPLDAGGRLDAGMLHAIAKGYLFAELETAGVIVCADAVAEARTSLQSTYALAARIERYVELQRRSPSTLEREAFYVRWFGLGRHAAMDEHGNHGFFPLFSELSGAFAAFAQTGIGSLPRAFVDERVRGVFDRLLAQLSLLAGGDVLIVERIERLASSGVAILSDPELGALLGAHGLTAVVQMLVGGAAQDLVLAYRRGRSGQALLEDCARLMSRASPSGAFVEPTDPAVTHAIQWLASYGIGGGGA